MLLKYYDSASPQTALKAGDPLDDASLIGPLHSPGAVKLYEDALAGIQKRGGEVLTKRSGRMNVGMSGNFVWPTIVRPTREDPCWTTE
jgi:aldehyde dehydrogenase family 7 protein A1